jgi:HAE1 family hydrophobic/amphiphilic exporter-1
VQYTSTIAGFSLLSGVQNTYSGFFFVTLKEWKERKAPEEQYRAIMTHLNRELRKLPEGIAFAFSPPAIPGVGASGGFTFVLEDRAGGDIPFLAKNVSAFMEAARKRPELAGLSTTFLPAVPQVFVDVDSDKVLKQGVELSAVYKTLQTFMGGVFVNYFNRFGRQWQVYVQAEGDYRTQAENLGQFFVKNSEGKMVPLAAVTRVEPASGPSSPCGTTSSDAPRSTAARPPASAPRRR